MEKTPVFQRRIFWDVDFDKLDYENEAGPGFVWEDANARFGIFCLIDGVKLDIVRNLHQRIGDRQKEDGHEDSGYIGSGTEKGFLGHWRTS